MSPIHVDSFLEPLARLLGDSSVSTVFVNGPNDVRIERQGRTEAAHLPLSLEDIEEMAAQVIRRSGMHPQQLQASCRLDGGLRLDLVRGAAVQGGAVLVLSRERGRPRDIEELFGTGEGGLDARDALRQALAERKGLLVVARNELMRSGFLMALVEELPPQERVILVDRGLYTAPRYPHLVRLLVDVAAGATRGKLIEAAHALRGQRLVLDEVSGPELRDLLLGEGEAFVGPVAGVAAATVEAALERLRAISLIDLGLAGGIDPLLADRFGMAVLVGEGPRRRPVVLQVVTLCSSAARPGSVIQQPLFIRDDADGELRAPPPPREAPTPALLLVPAPATVTPPAAAPAPALVLVSASAPAPASAPASTQAPARPPLGAAAPPSGSAAVPGALQPLLRDEGPPAGEHTPVAAAAGWPAGEPSWEREPRSPTGNLGTAPAARSASRPADLPPPTSRRRLSPVPVEQTAPVPRRDDADAQRPAMRTMAVTRPDDIFDEMFASLHELPAVVLASNPPATSPPAGGFGRQPEEIDDSLLFGADPASTSGPTGAPRTRTGLAEPAEAARRPRWKGGEER
ncbi:MAG: hypothetical protein FJ125_13695 [Deltaproteobacteria bacterium]|nr:hypothetical protein [Deltaproteobacteria bacterium]